MVHPARRVFHVGVQTVTSANIMLKSLTEFPHIVPEARQLSPLFRGECFGELSSQFGYGAEMVVEWLIGR